MNILIIGNGAREHALIKLFKQNNDDNLFIWPGNSALFLDANKVDAKNKDEIIEFIDKNIDLTIIGPEKYLAEGYVDSIKDSGNLVFGPNQFASQLETSKDFAKKFMSKYNIPTASYKTIYNKNEMDQYKNELKYPFVIKYDGLAGGKGVFICSNEQEYQNAYNLIYIEKKFGNSGKIIVEEFLEGPELSVIAIVSDGEYMLLPFARDYKRLNDDNKGPNTGGMGCISDWNLVNKKLKNEVIEKIVSPTVKGFKKDNLDYNGFVFIGIMLTKNGPKVLEYNCRFGDPEAEVILPKLSGDSSKFFLEATKGKINNALINIEDSIAITVIGASKGYPYNPIKGDLISGFDLLDKDSILYYSGIDFKNDSFYSNGGRVFAVTRKGTNIEKVRNKVYNEIDKIKWDNIVYRKDIAKSY